MLWQVLYRSGGVTRFGPSFRTEAEAVEQAELMKSAGIDAWVSYYFPTVFGD